MAGKKDIVEQALKLVVGSGEKVAPKVRTIRNLKGVPIAPPVEFYRGTNPGSTERIVTGAPEWDSYLFAADNPDAARLYGSEIEKITANPDAKILYEGTADWNKIAGRWRKNENMLQYADRAAKAAKEAGYDAAWFKRQSDIGTPIFNVEKFVRGRKAEGGRIAKGPGGFLDDVVRMAGKIVSGEGGEEAAKTGIRAYHGSPHSFEKFDMGKIGTGEGAQAYGHGLYFAENEDIARSYRDALSRPLNTGDLGRDLANYAVTQKRGSVNDAIAYLNKEMANYDNRAAGWPSPEYKKQYEDALEILASGDWNPSGSMYEVNINADPAHFLDWDKPLSEQPAVLDKLKAATVFPGAADKLPTLDSGERFYRFSQNYIGEADPVKISQKLKDAGIPGIKYADAGSRTAAILPQNDIARNERLLGQIQDMLKTAKTPKEVDELRADLVEVQRRIDDAKAEKHLTRNYVVFDDKLISIIRKYGIAGASAMLGYNLMERLDPKQALAATVADREYKSNMPVDEGDDVNNAIRLARDVGGAANENPQVFLTDAQGRQYDAQGKPIQPVATQEKSNSAATPAAPTPEEIGRRAAEDPATFDALMQKYAIPDRDVAEYEALQTAVRQQPQEVQQMTHIGAPPMRDVKVDMPLLGGEYNMGQAPYNVAGPMSTAAQTAYDLKTAPLYMFGATAPLAAGIDVAEGVTTGDPMQASLAALGAPGKFTKGAIIGLSNYAMDPAQAEAGPARWFSKAMEVAREIPMNKMTGEQALDMLRKSTSPEELRWTGADVVLQNRPQVTKDELVDYLNKNRVQVNEIILGNKPKPVNYLHQVDQDILDRYEPQFQAAEAAHKEALDKFYPSLGTENEEITWKAVQDAKRAQNNIEAAAIQEMRDRLGPSLPVKYGPESGFGEKYTTPGGTDYRETLITLPVKGAEFDPSMVRIERRPYSTTQADVSVYYGDKKIGTFADKIEMDQNGNFSGSPDQYWIDAVKKRFYGDTNLGIKPLSGEQTYQSSHWPGQPNVIAHVRSQILDAISSGVDKLKKAWNADEIQSDWGQAARQRGVYDAEARQKWEFDLNSTQNELRKTSKEIENRALELELTTDLGMLPPDASRDEFNAYHARRQNLIDSDPEIIALRQKNKELIDRRAILEETAPPQAGVPNAPYIGATEGWTDLAIKKSLDKALDSGSDYFTWTPGAIQAQRYNLRNYVSQIQYYKENGKYILGVVDKKGNGIDLPQESFSKEELQKYLGKEVADKIISGEGKMYRGSQAKSLEGLDLEIGGEGMIGYYDKIVPKRVEDVIRKATGKKPKIEVITVQTANGPRQQLGIKLDDLRDARFSEFNKGGRVTGGYTYDNNSTVDRALALTSEY